MAVTDPKPMLRAAAVAYAICSPLGLIALVFLPVGRLDWKPGWIFVAFLSQRLAPPLSFSRGSIQASIEPAAFSLGRNAGTWSWSP